MHNDLQVYLVHGFLGHPRDWEFLPKQWNRVELFNIAPAGGLPSWAKSFNESVAQSPGKKLLVGYSLGGRLALHALLDRADIWDGAVVVSAHPGLQTPEEKRERLAADMLWSKRFIADPWDRLMADWSAQPVFSGDGNRLPRKEGDYCRQTLAAALDLWSLGRQEDLRGPLRTLSVPLLWIAGERDSKFAGVARGLQFSHPKSKVSIASEAGHGVPWQKKESFRSQLETFFEELT